ncbi:MAG: PadR family transcriptional regulator [Candidatus Bathyarchaeia archaeon]|jgi:DNA-binding PadR family transcriptional regulator
MENSKTNSTCEVFVECQEKKTEYSGGTPLEKKIIKNFTDLLILKHLQKYPLVSGYEILNYLRRKFDIPFSPGTIYNAVYSLERHGLIKGNGNEAGRKYKLTNKGGKMIDTTVKAQKRIQQLFADIVIGE